jgi:hypothetical protein
MSARELVCTPYLLVRAGTCQRLYMEVKRDA